MSTLMFWNKQNANANQNNEAKNGKKNWLHAPDALVNGHVAYLVKFLGATPVDQAKGIETVKDAIRRLQFAQQIKKSEGNNLKSKKVEITISVDGVAVQEPRAQKVLHQFPLHDISYCADEKGVKKFFSFIAKTNNSVPNGNGGVDDSSTTNNQQHNTGSGGEESHKCFVFISSKLASDITLTIGQAFELAYRRYMTDGTKTNELYKLQTQNKQLENSVSVYRQRLKDLMDLVPRADLDRLLLRYGARDMLEVQPLEIAPPTMPMNGGGGGGGGNKSLDLGIDVSSLNDDQLLIETSPGGGNNKHFVPPMVPPRNLQSQINNTLDAFKPSVGTKLEGLLLNSDSDSDFDPRADESDTSSSQTTNGGQKLSNDLFGFEPPQQQKSLGQQLFAMAPPQQSVTNGGGGNNNNNNMMNGSTSNGLSMMNGNGNGYQMSPPPLLAPPPKAAVPRRSAPIQNNNNVNAMNNNSSQDLFGSMPFGSTASTPFDASINGCTTTLFNTTTTPSTITTTTNNGSSFQPFTDVGRSDFGPVGNPFNESGIFLNESQNSLSAFDATVIGSEAPPVTVNPFRSINTDLNADLASIKMTPNGFAAPPQTVPNGSSRTAAAVNTVNYDAFRMVDLEMMRGASHGLDAAVTTKTTTKSNGEMDMFKDAATSAFQQFGNFSSTSSSSSNASSLSYNPTTTTTTTHNKHDNHFNMTGGSGGGGRNLLDTQQRMGAGFDSFGFDTVKNNFNKNSSIFSTDDFTLESLDPLRK